MVAPPSQTGKGHCPYERMNLFLLSPFPSPLLPFLFFLFLFLLLIVLPGMTQQRWFCQLWLLNLGLSVLEKHELAHFC